MLWEFHQVHHSQRELNYLSDLRVHPLDWIAAQLVQFIPFFCLSLDEAVPTFATIEIFKIVHTRFCHTNLRTNLGWLRYLLVTPQSHRVHHSLEIGHIDRNFGVIFSFWDRLFGTAHEDVDCYPATGVRDQEFPREMRLTWSSLALVPMRQFAYPILKLLGRLPRQYSAIRD